jgi:hypothetical protein
MKAVKVLALVALCLAVAGGCATWVYGNDIAMRDSLLRISAVSNSRDPSRLLGYADVDLLASSIAYALPGTIESRDEDFPRAQVAPPRESFRAQLRGPVLAYVENGGVTSNPFVRDVLDVLSGRGAASRVVSTDEIGPGRRVVRIEHRFEKTNAVSTVDIVFEKRDGRWMATEIRNLRDIVTQLETIHWDEVRAENANRRRLLASIVRVDEAAFVSDGAGERIRLALTSICDRRIERVVVRTRLHGGIEGRGDVGTSFALDPGETRVDEAGLERLDRMSRRSASDVSVEAFVSAVRFSDGEVISLLEER